MGRPVKPLPVKLIVGMIAQDTALFEKTRSILSKKLGKIDLLSPILDFNQTDYYEKELGSDLKKRFLSFRELVPAQKLVKIKLFTNGLEKKLSKKGRQRAINLDPGYVTLSKLVLASTKNYSHRIYCGGGIFQEITLYFKDGTFEPGPWTYPDYRTEKYIALFNEIREKYRAQIERKYGLSQLYRCV